MATQEYYIREASENEARGPYNMEQLVSLAETGQVTIETLWYDPAIEDWSLIGNSDSLKGTLFPEKRKLRMKAKEAAPAVRHGDAMAPITVEDMLAGAEGRTADTKDKKDPAIMQAHAARIGMWAAVLCFLGGLDLFMAVMLGLGVLSFYPFVRFRAALGLGLYGFMFFVQGWTVPIGALAAGSVGLYFCTVFVDLLPVLVAALVGVLGSAATAYFLLST